MKKLILCTMATVAVLLSGCSTLAPQYSYVVDQEQVSKAENLKSQHRDVAHIVWVNPPLKRVTTTQPQL